MTCFTGPEDTRGSLSHRRAEKTRLVFRQGIPYMRGTLIPWHKANMKGERSFLGALSSVLLAVSVIGSGCVSPKPTGRPPAPSAKPEGPPTHTVVRGTLQRTVQLEAVFEAATMQPLKLEAKAWPDLTVVEAVPHGARVKQGDVLVKVDTERLEEQIQDLEQDRPAAAAALEIAAAELANMAQTTPFRLEAARRARRVAAEDYDYFEKTGREQREKNSRFNVKNSEQSLANATEELRQLEKMYRADDKVEETEEIILKRQRYGVEAAQFEVDRTRLGSDRELKVFIPREAETLNANDRDQGSAVTLAEETLPTALARKRLEVEKMKRDQAKAEKRLADLRSELAALPVRAPLEGIVYYGACEGGKWTTGAMLAKKLVPGGKLAPFEVFITVVDPHRLQLKAAVPESDWAKVKPGLTGEAAPVAAPDRKVPVKVEGLESVPLLTGGFEARLSVELEAGAPWVPGMNCKVTLGGGPKTEVPLAPKEAVFTESDRKFVYVSKGEAKPERRSVTVGDSDDKLIEILSGVAAGDKLLLKKPD
jgi:HlyD family secretion protein